MIPKQKAKELVEKLSLKFPMISPDHFVKQQAKQCALIFIDEIIKEIEAWNFGVIDYTNRIKFWKKVKKEINKL